MEQRQITGLTSRPELNGAVVEILGRDASTGRLRVRVVGRPELGAMALKRENLTELSWSNTAKQAFSRLDVNELRQNARYFWSKPAAKVVLALLALAILSSRRPAATPARRRRTPSARERECYALGFVDALKKRDYGSSIGANDAEHDDLVEATLEDLPPEAQGIRDQWSGQQDLAGGRTRAAARPLWCGCMLYKQVIYTQPPPPRAGRQAPASPPPVRAAQWRSRGGVLRPPRSPAQSEPPSAPRRARAANLARTPTRRGP